MLTNDLKKGAEVILRNGWTAQIRDNKKGNIRTALVRGIETETGSIYSHDIMYVVENGFRWAVEHTTQQDKVREINRQFFGE